MSAVSPSSARARRRAIEALLPVAESASAPESPRAKAIRRLKENRLALAATAVLTLTILMVLAAPVFEEHWAGRTATEQNVSGTVEIGGKEVEVLDKRGVPQIGPGLRREYTLGADQLGRDVFMRILRGGSVSLTIALGAAAITVFFGVLLGTTAGFFGGKIDAIISRCFDIVLGVPSVILASSLSIAMMTSDGFLFVKRGSLGLPIFVIGVIAIPVLGRIVRSQVLSLARRDYVEAARALGATNSRIMVRHIVPNVVSLVVTYFGILLSGFILTEAALSFLGIGVQPPTPSWGNIIADGKEFYSTAWWIALYPGLMIVLVVVTVNIISQGVEEAFDPKAIEGG